MKKILLVLFVTIFALGANAQNATKTQPATKAAATTTAVAKKQVANPAAYACPKCFNISKGAGKCEHCNVDKVQLGTYYCMKCMKGTGSKPGACPTCKGATIQITRKYCAAHDMKKGSTKM